MDKITLQFHRDRGQLDTAQLTIESLLPWGQERYVSLYDLGQPGQLEALQNTVLSVLEELRRPLRSTGERQLPLELG